MRTLQDAKKTYDETAIPSELSERIQMEIKKADRKRKKVLQGFPPVFRSFAFQ